MRVNCNTIHMLRGLNVNAHFCKSVPKAHEEESLIRSKAQKPIQRKAQRKVRPKGPPKRPKSKKGSKKTVKKEKPKVTPGLKKKCI